jgi:hypothetical protein
MTYHCYNVPQNSGSELRQKSVNFAVEKNRTFSGGGIFTSSLKRKIEEKLFINHLNVVRKKGYTITGNPQAPIGMSPKHKATPNRGLNPVRR